MFRKSMMTKSFLVKSICVLIGVAGLWLLGVWLLSVPQLSASEALPALLTFDSPIGNPQLALDKTVDNEAPEPDSEITYTLTYSNTDPGSQAFNVRLYDFLPAGVQFLSASPSATTHTNGVLLFTAPSVGPTTDNVNVTVRVRVLGGYEQLYNYALVVADGVTPAYASLLTGVEQPLTLLRLTKTGYPVVLVNDVLVYTLRCENTSSIALTDVMVVDVLPTGLPLVGASPWPDEVTLPMLRWSLGNVGPGEIRTIVITTTAPAEAGEINNTALAAAQQGVLTQTVFATQVVTEAIILRVTKEGSAPAVDLGDELVYTLRYENAGNLPATGVVLTDTLPSDIIVTGVHPSATLTTPQQLVWDLLTLNPGGSGEIVITATVRGKADRTLHNVVDITAQQPDSFSGHAELDTYVRPVTLYLPVVMRNFSFSD